MTLIKAAKDEIWLKGLMRSLGFSQGMSIIFCDNMSAIYLSNDNVQNGRTKHIKVNIILKKGL